MFMRVNLETVDYAKWQWLPGLRFIVSYGGLPVMLPETTINLIRDKLNKIEVSGNQPAKDFKPGDNVRITEGPLRDMLAVFDGPTTSSQRVQVLLTILGSVKKVKIDALNLEKTPSGTQVPIPKKPRRTRGRGRYIKGTTQQA
jgi:transcription antitermination factor NusG